MEVVVAFTAKFAVQPQMDSAKLNAWRKAGVLEVAIIGSGRRRP